MNSFTTLNTQETEEETKKEVSPIEAAIEENRLKKQRLAEQRKIHNKAVTREYRLKGPSDG
jgi:hypothetical protein